MRLLLAQEQRYTVTPDGTVYTASVFNYAFWCRYLEVFDEVLVFARQKPVPAPVPGSTPSSGPKVTFLPVPDFRGAREFFSQRRRLHTMARSAVGQADAFLLRVPGTMGTVIWRRLMKTDRPYAVEVVGDPWDVLAPGNVESPARPLLRRMLRRDLVRQCAHAEVAAYVTESALQRRYPPGAWNTHYSSIELSPEAILTRDALAARHERTDAHAAAQGPWRLCYAGTMAQIYKAPHVLVDAVADCLHRGLRVELVMLGEGVYRPRIEQQVRDLGIAEHVHFLGALAAGPAVYEQLDQSDLFVLPSLTEGLPRAVIEAMARGLPCISSNVGGLPEVVPVEFLVPPGDAPALADRITAVLADIEGMKQVAERNLSRAAEFRSEVLRERRLEAYTKLREVTQGWMTHSLRKEIQATSGRSG